MKFRQAIPLKCLLSTILLLSGCSSNPFSVRPATSIVTRRQENVTFHIAPAGKEIIFAAQGRGGSGIYRMDLQTKRVRLVSDSPDYEITPAFSPKGTQIACAIGKTINDAPSIYLLSREGKRSRLTQTGADVASHPYFDRYPSFSPDGKTVVFARAQRRRPYSMGGYTWDRWDIYVADIRTGSVKRVSDVGFDYMTPPRFMPDGHSVVFSAGNPESTDVYTAQVAGARLLKRITRNGKCDWSAITSNPKSAKQLVYISDRLQAFDYELWLMKFDGTGQQQLTRNQSYNLQPQFMPDGQSIFFLSDPKRENRYSLWRVMVDGSQARQLADAGLFDQPLSWRPPAHPKQ